MRSVSTAMRSMCSTMELPRACAWRWLIREEVLAIVSQNGNAYEEGLSDAWAPIQACGIAQHQKTAK